MGFKEVVAGGIYLVRAALRSPNYVQATSGWTVNYDGSAEFNNVTVRGTIVVGNANGQNITITNVGSIPEIQFNSGLAGETAPAFIAEVPFTQPNSGSTEAMLQLQSPTYNNGTTVFTIRPPDTQDPAVIEANTSGTTAPAGFNGVKGIVAFGNQANNNDPWELYISNENSVIVAGPAVGTPPLVLGNQAQSRLLVSVTELLSLDGSNNTENIYLNSNNAETVAGPISSVRMRHLFARDINTYTFTPGNGAFVHPTGSTAFVNFVQTASGVFTIHYKIDFNATTAAAGTVLTIDVNVFNVTQSTTPYAGSTNNGAEISTTFPVNCSVSGFVTVGGVGGQGGVLGNIGDTLQAIVSYTSTNAAGTWTILKQQLTVMPSL